ncbi:hypothetical protein SAMN05880556_101913 [Azospirillum sp. RU38E]|nr:hypothetical protein SAMN05880556_101913 [Azospirillum sp. RU38E]SNS15103.1 hypothetical protein SAMN05880591_101913 [Azospirillum sp. RU37A]
MVSMSRGLLLGAIVITGAGLLSACSINVNDDGVEPGRYAYPRTATDQCRREVERTYGDRYRVAYDLPELSSSGSTQIVVQRFTLALRKDNFEPPQRRSLRCTVDGGALTQVVPE